MAISVGVSSAWKSVTSVKIGVSGVWKGVTQIWVGVGGAWKACFATVFLQNDSRVKVSVSPTDARAGWRCHSDGTVDSGVGTTGVTYNNMHTWLLSGANSDYQIRATLASGDTPSVGTMDTWEVLSTTRTWENIVTASGQRASTITFEIRDVATSTVQASCSVYLEAFVEL